MVVSKIREGSRAFPDPLLGMDSLLHAMRSRALVTRRQEIHPALDGTQYHAMLKVLPAFT